MKTNIKSRFKSIVILGLIILASFSIAMWEIFGFGKGTSASALTDGVKIAEAINGAKGDWKTGTEIVVGDDAASNGAVVANVPEITVPQGANVTINAVEPSVQHELENTAVYSQLIIEGKLTVSSEAVLTINCDVVFKGGVEVNGTLIIGGMAFNQSAMQIKNKENEYAEIKSEGVIVKGSLNNDGKRDGSITVDTGASLTVNGSTTSSYFDGSSDGTFSNNDGGALFLKADSSNSSALTLEKGGKLVNDGSIIYESSITSAPAPTEGDGVVVSASFVSSLDNISGTAVLYPNSGDGTPLTLGNSANKDWSNLTLLSFGRTILENGADNVSYNLTNVNLGGGTSGEKTFTQGANELIFDGGAVWRTDSASSYGYTLSFILGDDPSAHTEYYNYNGSSSTNSALVNVIGTVNVYNGIRVTRHETRAGESNGGGIKVGNGATLNMYGGEVSYNAVTQCTNNGAGGGIFADQNSKINIYNGKVTRNALGNYGDRSADGAGIAMNGNGSNGSSVLTVFGGEISYNCGATGGNDPSADGGGIIGRQGTTVNLYSGGISNNWTGGYGGALLLWNNSKLNMTGGEISGNWAAYGGGINMTDNSSVDVSGGYISGNTAFYNSTTSQGGYGGGICVGAKGYETTLTATFRGDAIVTENDAVYGGGLAVYTSANSSNRNRLIMEGGTITNNTADARSYGSGVYVSSTGRYSYSVLDLSGNASIDSSNNVSFNSSVGLSAAPINVSGNLTGSGLAALVYLENPQNLTSNNVVAYSDNVTVDRNKFLLDNTNFTFYEHSERGSIWEGFKTSYYLRIQSVTDEDDYVARIEGKQSYTSLEEAVNKAVDEDTITVLRSSTIANSMQISGKNITIVPAADEDITLGVASDFTVSSVGGVNALFLVSDGGSLTIGGSGGNLALDGNKSSGKDMAMVYVANGSFTLGQNATLRNNNSSGNAGALYLGQDNSATISGTITDTSGRYGAIYVETRANLTISGATFSGNCANGAGMNFAVYAVGNESKIEIGGNVNFGSNAVYTENKITLGTAFVNEGAAIGVTFPAERTAGTTIVDIPVGYTATEVQKQFTVVNMDADYKLILSTEATGVANALVVSKSVVFVFDFTYTNGFGQDTKQETVDFGDLKEILENYDKVDISEHLSRIHTRGNLVVLELQSGSNFPLAAFEGYASRSGYSLIRWEVNGTSTSYNYNGNIAYLDSETEVSVRSVWVENTYNISFNTNAAKFGNSVTFGGTMEEQEIAATAQDASLTPNKYTLVGYKFTGWNTDADGNGTAIDDMGKPEFTQMTSGEPVYITTVVDGVPRVTGAEYNITLYAQWQCIFAGGGEGTSNRPFIINNVNDLYILEATVNGDKQGTDTSAVYSALDGYFNTNDEKGAVSYVAESYEGYYFRLADNFANTENAFRGVIGRIAGADHEEQEHNVTTAIYGTDGATIGGEGAAVGTPFMGSFDGNGETITLNINKQAAGTVAGDETLVGVGLFGYTDHATIKNVTLAGSVHGYAHVGGLVGYAFGGNISSIYNKAAITSGGHDVGGVIGTFYELADHYSASSVTDVANDGTISYAPREGEDKTTLPDSDPDWNELEIITDAEGVRFGGVIGAGIALRLTGGYNTGNITARYGVGGVVGTLRSQDNSTTNDSFISQSFNSGEITATSGLYAITTSPKGYSQDFITAYTGGITGRLVGRSAVNTSFNTGKVTATYAAKVGEGSGIDAFEYVGMTNAPKAGDEDNAKYIGARGVGGIVGFTSYDASSTSQVGRMAISDVYNTGEITSFAGVGGIVGYLAYGNVSEAFNGGNITAFGTHYDDEMGMRTNGGYMMTSDNKTVYAAYLGSVVGRGVNVLLTATVSFNMNSTYNGYTDATVQAIGDSGYNAEFGFGENSTSAKGLTSSQMRVESSGRVPSGFDPTFDGGAWAFEKYSDTYSYYPQLKVFVNAASKTIGGSTLNIAKISQDSALIKYRAEGSGGDEDKPVVDTEQFKLTFNLGGGSFVFDDAGGTDENGEYFTFADPDKHKHYFASGSNYYYLFSFPNDTVDYGEDAGGTGLLEMPEDPVRTGYTFGGWYIDAGCTQAFNFNAIPGQNTTIYAKWDAVVYTITYENVVGVGGTWTGDYNKTFSILTNGKVALPTASNLVRRGYTFSGWKYAGIDGYITHYSISTAGEQPAVVLQDAEGTNKATVAFSDLTAGTLVLTAEWTPTTYNITYNITNNLTPDGRFADGQQATLGEVQTTYNVASSDISLPVPEKLGYTFRGWKLVSIDGKTEITDETNRLHYTIGGIVKHIRNNTVGNFVLQAMWERNEITLYLDARGGQIANYDELRLSYESTTGLYYTTIEYYETLDTLLFNGEEWKIKTSGLVGNEFIGWYESSTATGDPVNAGTCVKVGMGSYTLYAGYKTAEYTLTIELGGTSGVEATISEENKLNLESRFGFSFDDGISLKVLHGEDASEALSELAAALEITKSWYFDNWLVSGGSIYNVTNDLTITAQYNQNRVTINFVGQDGTLLKPISVPVGGTIAGDETAKGYYEELLKMDELCKSFGYTFENVWTYGGSTFDENTVVNNSMVVYAKFTPWTVNAEFYLVNSNGTSEKIEIEGLSYTFGSAFGKFPTLDELIKAYSGQTDYLGYKIDGIYLDSGLKNAVTINTPISDGMWRDMQGNNPLTLTLYVGISKETYSIIFNANGGIFHGSETSITGTYQYGKDGWVKYGAQSEGFPDVSREGYNLTHWYISGANGKVIGRIDVGCEDYVAELLTLLQKEDIKYVGSLNAIAYWTEEIYDVWFYAGENGQFIIPEEIPAGVVFYNDTDGMTPVESGTAKYCVVDTKYGSVPSLPASVSVQKVGYTFNGWLTSGGAAVTAVFDNNTYTSDKPISAQWIVSNYTIVFITNGGSSVEDIKSVEFGTKLGTLLSGVSPTRKGYTFVGWYTDSGLNDPCPDTMPASSLVLYAKWEKVTNDLTLTITLPEEVTGADNVIETAVKAVFEGLGLEISVTPADNVYTVTIVGVPYETSLAELNSLKLIVGDKTYVIDGMWQNSDRGIVLDTMPETPLSVSASFKEQQEATGYTVTFYRGERDVFYTLSGVTEVSSDLQELLVPTRTGYTFEGWWTAAEGGTEFEFGKEISGDVELYAHWKANEYIITLELRGGSADYTTIESVPYDYDLTTDSEKKLPEPTRDGYSFNGWYIDSSCEVDATTMPNGNLTLYAGWTAVDYKLVFNYYANGSDQGGQSKQKAEIGATIDYPNADVKKYYSFDGWYIVGGEHDGEKFEAPNMPNLATLGGETSGNVVTLTIKAKYSPITYTADYRDDSGVLPEKFTVSADNTGEFDLKTLEENKTGYNFKGWKVIYGNNSEGEHIYVKYRVEATGIHLIPIDGVETEVIGFEYLENIDFIAVYEPVSYTVTLDENYGDKTSEITVTYDGIFGNKLTEPKRDGYTFLGWFTQKDGGTQIKSDTVVTEENATILYAHWQANEYTVIFDANGGTGTTTILVTYDAQYILPEHDPTREGYTFLGWWTKDGDKITESDRVTTAGIHTLYAHWKPIETIITFVGGDGASGSMEEQTFTFGGSAVLNPNGFEKTGYHFLGWATESEGSVVYVNGATVRNIAQTSLTLYAVWEANTYTVVFNGNGGTGSMSAQSFTYNAAQNLKLNTFSRTGYTFLGWSTDHNASSATYENGQEVNNLATENGATVTLYAVWKIDTYTVTFDAGEGRFNYEGIEGDGKTIKLNVQYGGNAWTVLYEQYPDLEIIAPDGKFASSIGDNYSDIFFVKGNITLKVEYSQSEVGVVLIYPDGSFRIVLVKVGNMLTEEDLRYDIPDGSGFTSYKWVDVTDGGEVNTDTEINKMHVLMLVLTGGNRIEVTLDTNGGSVSDYTVELTVGDVYGELEIPVREGYMFLGWWTKDGTAGDWGTQITADTKVSLTTAHTIYAKWQAIEYNVYFFVDNERVHEATYTEGQPIESYDGFTPEHGYYLGKWMVYDAEQSKYIEFDFDGQKMPSADLYLYAVTIAEDVQITLNADDGTVDPSSVTAKYNSLYSDAKLPVPEKKGYKFLGWMLNGELIETGARITPEGEMSVTLTAKWELIEYNINYVLNGGTNAVGAVTSYNIEDGEVPLPTPTREGYDFLGWYTSEDGDEKLEMIEVDSVGDITLYARWQIKNYKVTFNGTNVNGSGDATVEHGSAYTYTLTAEEGYTLPDSVTITMGGKEFKDFTYRNGVIIIESGKIVGNLEITAVGEIRSYTVTFDTDGGSKVDEMTAEHGSTISAPEPPTRTGYDFLGWYLGEEEYSFETPVTQDITLTAKWQANEYTVELDANGGSVEPSQITVTYYETYGEQLVTPVREGYIFLGWWTEKEGGTQVTADTLVTITENITLYARWQIESFDITLEFTLPGGVDSAIVSEIRAYISDKLENKATVTFSGNVIKVQLTRQYGAALSDLALMFNDKYSEIMAGEQPYLFVWNSTPSGNLGVDGAKFSGKWTNESVRTVKISDGENVIGTYYVAEKDGSYTFDLTKVSLSQKVGKVFDGWLADGNGKIDGNTLTITGASVTVTAQWRAITYTVTYSGDGVSPDSISFTYDGEKFTLTDGGDAELNISIVRTGYTFNGWKYQSFTVTTLSELFEKAGLGYGDSDKVTISLTAEWTANSYSVTFNGNGGSGAMSDQTIIFGQATALNLNTFVRAGYTFGGWSYGGKTYSDGEEFTITEEMVASGIELVAVWTENSYTISYDTQGGNVIDDYTSVFTSTVTLAIPKKDGCTFLGWAEEADGEIVYTGGATLSIGKLFTGLEGEDERTLTLYAIWRTNTYTVTFNANGGSEVVSQTINHGLTATEPEPPTRTGYKFLGWYVGEDKYDFATPVTKDITLTAKWQINGYTVTFDTDGGSDIQSQRVDHGLTATTPEEPVKSGYKFLGWYLGNDKYDFSTPVIDNLTLKAKWQVVDYTITYVLNGGTNADGAATIFTIESKDITLLAPTRDGFTFLGWYSAEEGGEKLEMIASGTIGDITLYARWQIDSFEVTFEANGGTLPDGANSQTIAVGGNVAYVEPQRENYLFLGWYTDEALTVRYDFNEPVTKSFTLYAKWRLQVIFGEAPDGTLITISSDNGFDDGTTLQFVEVSDEDILAQTSGNLAENISLKRMFDIRLVGADGKEIVIDEMLSVGISAEGLGDAVGRFSIIYVPDGDGEIEHLATHIGADGKLYFFVEHFSYYAIVDITEIVPQAGFAWWWILVAIGGCALIAAIVIIIARSNRRYELNYVNGGIPSTKLKESMLIDLPVPERETEVFEGWYYDEDFRDRAFLTSMPKQNLILFAKWRTMTQEERVARDRARAEAAAAEQNGKSDKKSKDD